MKGNDSSAVENVEPKVGKYNDVITITGSHFSTAKEKNNVRFNGFPAVVLEASTTKLKVKVPGTVNKDNTISVTANLQTAKFPDPFVILP